MTLYVNKDYYTDIYKGTIIPTDDIEYNLELAQEKIDSITFNRIIEVGFDNLTEFQQEKVSKAICSQAEYIYKHGYNNEDDSDISSYSVLDISVNVESNSDNKTKAKKLCMSERAYSLIKQTGLDCRING